MWGSENGGNGGDVQRLIICLEAIRGICRLERLNWRQAIDETEKRRVLHPEKQRDQAALDQDPRM